MVGIDALFLNTLDPCLALGRVGDDQQETVMRPLEIFIQFELREVTEELFALLQGAAVHLEVAGKLVVKRPDGPGRHLAGIKINVNLAADSPIGKNLLALQEIFDFFDPALHFPADVGQELAVVGGRCKRLWHQGYYNR